MLKKEKMLQIYNMWKCIFRIIIKNISRGLHIERKRFGVSRKDWAEAVS